MTCYCTVFFMKQTIDQAIEVVPTQFRPGDVCVVADEVETDVPPFGHGELQEMLIFKLPGTAENWKRLTSAVSLAGIEVPSNSEQLVMSKIRRFFFNPVNLTAAQKQKVIELRSLILSRKVKNAELAALGKKIWQARSLIGALGLRRVAVEALLSKADELDALDLEIDQKKIPPYEPPAQLVVAGQDEDGIDIIEGRSSWLSDRGLD